MVSAPRQIFSSNLLVLCRLLVVDSWNIADDPIRQLSNYFRSMLVEDFRLGNHSMKTSEEWGTYWTLRKLTTTSLNYFAWNLNINTDTFVFCYVRKNFINVLSSSYRSLCKPERINFPLNHTYMWSSAAHIHCLLFSVFLVIYWCSAWNKVVEVQLYGISLIKSIKKYRMRTNR